MKWKTKIGVAGLVLFFVLLIAGTLMTMPTGEKEQIECKVDGVIMESEDVVCYKESTPWDDFSKIEQVLTVLANILLFSVSIGMMLVGINGD